MSLKKICRVVGTRDIKYTYGEKGPVIKEILFTGRIESVVYDYGGIPVIPKSLKDKIINGREMGPKIVYPEGGRRWFHRNVDSVKAQCYSRKYHRMEFEGDNKTSTYFAKYDYGNVNSSKKT